VILASTRPVAVRSSGRWCGGGGPSPATSRGLDRLGVCDSKEFGVAPRRSHVGRISPVTSAPRRLGGRRGVRARGGGRLRVAGPPQRAGAQGARTLLASALRSSASWPTASRSSVAARRVPAPRGVRLRRVRPRAVAAPRSSQGLARPALREIASATGKSSRGCAGRLRQRRHRRLPTSVSPASRATAPRPAELEWSVLLESSRPVAALRPAG